MLFEATESLEFVCNCQDTLFCDSWWVIDILSTFTLWINECLSHRIEGWLTNLSLAISPATVLLLLSFPKHCNSLGSQVKSAKSSNREYSDRNPCQPTLTSLDRLATSIGEYPNGKLGRLNPTTQNGFPRAGVVSTLFSSSQKPWINRWPRYWGVYWASERGIWRWW